MPGSTEICILGSRELTEPFRGLGLAQENVDAENVLERAQELSSSDYKIVFYAEEFYPLLREFLGKRSGGVFPTFVPIPSVTEGERYATQRLRELIKKAIGVDVYWEAQ
ncbi:hypothetical protein GF338_12335 [candidate division WOR-3 bacterium]|nr:hypothetical protein [candidate division WOR-3 bacterium]